MINAAMSLAGGISSLFGKSSAQKSARTQYNYNLALQKQAQAWNEKMYKNRYQWQVEDLEKAGINKLYGLGTAPMTTSGTNAVGMPDEVSEMSSKRQNILEAVNMAQNWSARKVELEKIKQETETEKVNTMLKTFEATGQQLDNLLKKKDLDYYDRKAISELKKTRSEILLNLDSAYNQREQGRTARETRNLIREQTKTERYRQEDMQEDIVSKNRENLWHTEHPHLSGAFTTMKNAGEAAEPLIDSVVTGLIFRGLLGGKGKGLTGAMKRASRNTTARR